MVIMIFRTVWRRVRRLRLRGRRGSREVGGFFFFLGLSVYFGKGFVGVVI